MPVWPNLTAQPAILGAQVRRVSLRPRADGKPYKDRLAAARKATGEPDAMAIGAGRIGGVTAVALVVVLVHANFSSVAVPLVTEVPAAVAQVGAEGAIVPFSSVAKIELDEGYTFVRREALQRYAVLQMDVQGRDVDSFVKDANLAIAALQRYPWKKHHAPFVLAHLGIILILLGGILGGLFGAIGSSSSGVSATLL